MKSVLISTVAGALVLAVAPAFVALTSSAHAASNQPPETASMLLNKASKANHEEQAEAGILNSKAGNDLALSMFATALKEDHAANQNAVEALANKEGVKLFPYLPDKPKMRELANLKGIQFDKTFLADEVKDHQKALKEFRQARGQVQNPAMKKYLDETIPVLQAHLEMARNLQRDLGLSGNNVASAH